MPAVAAAEVGNQFLLGTVRLGRGEPQRCCCAAEEVHPGAACSPAHPRIRQHLRRRQRLVAGVFNVMPSALATTAAVLMGFFAETGLILI